MQSINSEKSMNDTNAESHRRRRRQLLLKASTNELSSSDLSSFSTGLRDIVVANLKDEELVNNNNSFSLHSPGFPEKEEDDFWGNGSNNSSFLTVCREAMNSVAESLKVELVEPVEPSLEIANERNLKDEAIRQTLEKVPLRRQQSSEDAADASSKGFLKLRDLVDSISGNHNQSLRVKSNEEKKAEIIMARARADLEKAIKDTDEFHKLQQEIRAKGPTTNAGVRHAAFARGA